MQKKPYNPFRAKFTKLAPADQIKVIAKVKNRHPTLLQILNEFINIDPVVSIRSDGRISLLTDGHLLKK